MCKIIVMEGIDGVGKASQSEWLKEALEYYGYNAELVSFPRYDTYWGKKIRKVLTGELHTGNATLNTWYDNDQREYMLTMNLSELDFLIIDRYTLSNLAFGIAKGLSEDFILANQSKSLPKADVTFILDIPPEVSTTRKMANFSPEEVDKNEKDLDLQCRAREAYKYLADKLSDVNGQDELIYTINANGSVPDVHMVIFDYIEKLGYLEGVNVYGN